MTNRGSFKTLLLFERLIIEIFGRQSILQHNFNINGTLNH